MLSVIIDFNSVEIAGLKPTSVTDIPGVAEQQFFLLLQQRLPEGTQIFYEPLKFALNSNNNGGKEEATIPDFLTVNPNGKMTFIEITTQYKNCTDPKEKQRKVMGTAAPWARYRILYGENLTKIQKHNPWVSFSGAKKIRKET